MNMAASLEILMVVTRLLNEKQKFGRTQLGLGKTWLQSPGYLKCSDERTQEWKEKGEREETKTEKTTEISMGIEVDPGV